MKQKLELPFKLDEKELQIIDQRIKEFKELGKKDTTLWFSELCFCLLTANAQAKRAIEIQNHLGPEGFINKTQEEIASVIKSFGHRFHNTKAKYIVLARKYIDIKDILKDYKNGKEAREFLEKNVIGLGYKEASHFLRNVGYDDVAIIDRHIIRFLYQYHYIDQLPKVITKKIYLELENILTQFGITLDKLDLMIWYHMTGTVLK